jgi:sarcosine oxidase subunit gamma
MSDDRARSALAHRTPLAAGGMLTLAERPFVGLVVLRGDAAEIAAPVEATTALALPRACRQTAFNADLAALWLSPDEWLLMTAAIDQAAALEARLATALEGHHHQIVPVADYYAVLELGGAALRSCLAKLVGLDLHPRAWRRDEVLATHLGKAIVQLWLLADEADAGGPKARVVVRRSLADYVWCLLAEAGREWGLPREAPVGRVRLEMPAGA